MEQFSYAVVADDPDDSNSKPEPVLINVSTEVGEPDRVYVSMGVSGALITASLTLEQTQEFRYALQEATSDGADLSDFHIEDLDKIDASLKD